MDTQYVLLVWFCCLTPFIPMFCCRNKSENRIGNCPGRYTLVNFNVSNTQRDLKRGDVSRIRFEPTLPGKRGSTVKTVVFDHHSSGSKIKPGPDHRQVDEVQKLMWEKMFPTFRFNILSLFINLCAWISIIWLFTVSSSTNCGLTHQMSDTKFTEPTEKSSCVETRDSDLRQLNYCHLNEHDSSLFCPHEFTIGKGLTGDIMTKGDLSLNSAFIECSYCSNIHLSEDVTSYGYALPQNLYDICTHPWPEMKSKAVSYPMLPMTMPLQREKDVFKHLSSSSNSAQCNPQCSFQGTDKMSNTNTSITKKAPGYLQVKCFTKSVAEISAASELEIKHGAKAASCPPKWTASSCPNPVDRKPSKCALPFPAERSVPDSRKLTVEFLQNAAQTLVTRPTIWKRSRGIVLDHDASEDAFEGAKHSLASKRNVGVIGERGDIRKLADWNSCDILPTSMHDKSQSQNKSEYERDLASSFIHKSTLGREKRGVGPQVQLSTCNTDGLSVLNHCESTSCCCEGKRVYSHRTPGLFTLNDVANQSFLSAFDEELSSSSASPVYDLDNLEKHTFWGQKDTLNEERELTEKLDMSPKKSDCKRFLDTCIPLLSSNMSSSTLPIFNPSEKNDTELDNLSSPSSTGSESSQMTKFHNFCLRLLETSFLGDSGDEETVNPAIAQAPSIDENQQNKLLELFRNKSPDIFRRNLTLSEACPQSGVLSPANAYQRVCLSDPEGRLEQVPEFCSMLASSCLDVEVRQNDCVIPHADGSTVESGSRAGADVDCLSLRLPLADGDDTHQADTHENSKIVTAESSFSSRSAPEGCAEPFSDHEGQLATSKKSARSKGPTKLPDVPMDMDFVYMSCKTGRLVPVKDFIRILESCYLGVDEKKDIVNQQYTIAREKCCLDWIEAIRNRGKRILPKWWLHRYMRAEGLESNKCRKRREWLERKQAQALEEERLREKKDLFFLGSRSDIGRYLEEPTGPEKILFNYGGDGIPGFQVEQYFSTVAESLTSPSFRSEVKVDLNIGQPSRWTCSALNTPREDIAPMYMSSPGRSRNAGGEPREHPGIQEATLQTSSECQATDRAVEDGSGDSFCES